MAENPFQNAEEKTLQQKEFKLQCHIVKKHEIYFPHIIMTAFPGRPGDAQDGFFKKMMGVRPGVTDILLWWHWKNFGVVEIKVDAKITSQQNKFMSAIHHIGGYDGVAHSWEEYYKLLCSFGVKPTSICTVFDEPCYATEQEKFHAAFEWYKP